MQAIIQHLEPLTRFRRRVSDLNRVYNPDDSVHGVVTMPGPKWQAYLQSADADPTLVTEGLVARKQLAVIHQSFPAGAAMHEQAAYLVRAFNGLRPFAEANHRTGWDYTAEIVRHAGHDLVATMPESRNLGNELWRVMESAYPDGFIARWILDEDEVWDYLSDYFHRRIA